MCTGRGLNALHLAASLGEAALMKRILRLDPALVNIVTREGASSLQLTARSARISRNINLNNLKI